MNDALQVVLAADQLPEDIGKAGPLGLLLIVLLLIAVAFLGRSMAGHLKKIPATFDPSAEVPDTPAELVDRAPGDEVLEELRRRPLAIEPPRTDRDRPESPESQG